MSKISKTESDIELNKEITAMVTAGRRRTNQLRAMNEDAVRAVFGDGNHKLKRTKGRKYPTLATPYGDMMQDISFLTANNPTISTPPREGTDVAVAKSLGGVLRGVWCEQLRMRVKIIAAVLDSHLNHCMVAKVFWDARDRWDQDKADRTGDGWKGKINCNVIKPEYFFCDPDIELAIDIPTKARFCGHVRWADTEAAALRWPEYKQYLIEKGRMDEKGNLIGVGKGEGGAVTSGTSTTDETGFNRTTLGFKGKEMTTEKEEGQQSRLADFILGKDSKGHDFVGRDGGTVTRVEELYSLDYSTVDVEALTEDEQIGKGDAAHLMQKTNDPRIYDTKKPIIAEGTDTVTGYEQFRGTMPQRIVRPAYKKPKYKNFRRVVIRLDGEFIAEKNEWDYKSWPYSVTPSHLLPHMWMGHNCVELSAGYDQWMNRIMSNLTTYLEYFGEPQLWVEEGALAKDKKTKRGKVSNLPGKIIKLVRGGITRIKREPPPPLPSAIFGIFEMFKRGSRDNRGAPEVSRGRSERGDQTKFEVAKLDINSKQRVSLKGALLDEWLKQIAIIICELMVKHFEIGDWVAWTGDEPDSVDAAVRWTREMADAQFDVILEPTSTMPVDNERETAKFLKANEIADGVMLPEVLKKMNIPNVKEILQRHPVHGLLIELLDMAKEAGMPLEAVAEAVKTQLALMKEMTEQMPAEGIRQEAEGISGRQEQIPPDAA